MVRRLLVPALFCLMSCSALYAASYDVDIDTTTSLDAVAGTDFTSPPPPGPPYDVTTIVGGDVLDIKAVNQRTVTASKLTIEDNGTLNLGFSSAGGITINLTDNGLRQDMTIGSPSGSAGVVNVGNADTNRNVTVRGAALNIANGTINYAYDTTSATTTLSLSFDSMAFDKGVINMVDEKTQLTIGSGGVVIGHGTDSADQAILNASSGASFAGGARVQRGGVLQNNGTVVNVSFGTNGRLTLAGGAVAANTGALNLLTKTVIVEKVAGAVSVIDATGGIIAFDTGAAMTVHGDLDVLGADTAITLASYKQDGGAVGVSGAGGLDVAGKGEITGGSFQAAFSGFGGGLDVSNGARLLHGSLALGAGTQLRIGKTAFMDLSNGNLSVGGGDVEIFGTLVVGADAGSAWQLRAPDSGAKVTFMEGSSIELSESFIDKLDGANYLGTVIVDVAADGAIVLPGGTSELAFDNFLYGEYTYALNADGDLALSSYFTGIDRDGTQADFEWAKKLLAEKYGALVGKSDGFALNIYKSAVRDDAAGVVPYDRLRASTLAKVEGSDAEKSYLMNLANLQAFARGADAATLDQSLAGMYTGLNNSGAIDAAMSTVGAVVDHVKMRLRCQNTARLDSADTICPIDAYPSSLLDSDYANRIWFGGFGLFEDARSRGGVAGYRYEPAGFVGGYDHAVDNFSVGLVYAYAKGDFADRTAISHDSKIASHSFGLHGTYFDPSGIYITGMGGYTFSSNDMNELRRDASVTGGASWNKADYHSQSWHGALEIGYEARVNDCLTITPSLGFTYIYATSNDHDELLGGVAAGRIRGVKNSAAFLPVRVEAGYEISTGAESRLKITANAGYAYNFSDDGIDGSFDLFGFENAVSHKVVGRDPGHHSYNLGAGVRFYTDRFDIGVRYDWYGKADYGAHQVTATAGFSF